MTEELLLPNVQLGTTALLELLKPTPPLQWKEEAFVQLDITAP